MTNRVWEGLLRFWATDHGLSVFLALLVIVAFALPPLATPGLAGRLAADLVFSLLLVAGAVAASERRWMRLVVPPIAVAALLVRWASVASPEFAVWREVATVATLGLFAVVVAAQVYRRGPVTSQRIQGAIAVFLLLGLAWANAYELLHLVRPGAFTGALGGDPGSHTWIYYSFVTLTTMGYGDITPVHPVARSLAVAEALTGQLYLAITLARLVALQLRSGDRG